MSSSYSFHAYEGFPLEQVAASHCQTPCREDSGDLELTAVRLTVPRARHESSRRQIRHYHKCGRRARPRHGRWDDHCLAGPHFSAISGEAEACAAVT